MEPATLPARAAACPGAPVVVQHVLLPETLDRRSMVRALGPNRLDVSNQDRWAAPLDDMIGRVLAEDLRQRLPPGAVLAPGDPGPPGGTAGLAVNFLRFMPDTAGRVTIRADWALLGPDGAERLARSESFTVDSSPQTQDVVAAMSRGVAELADHVVAVLSACSTSLASL